MAVIDVALVTWPNHPKRIEYLKRTLDSLNAQIFADHHKWRWYCSSESERDPAHSWHGDELAELCRARGVILNYRHGPANLGANMNAAMRMGSGDFVFIQQDDWVLGHPLDLSPGADLLAAHPEIDIVRYNWPGGSMSPTFAGAIDGWPLIDNRGRWPYGDDPHLRRRDFMEKWGWYYDKGLHGTASATLMGKLIAGKAKIVTADQRYYSHCGYTSANIIDSRPGRGRRAETA